MSFLFSHGERSGRALLVYEYTQASLRRRRPFESIQMIVLSKFHLDVT